MKPIHALLLLLLSGMLMSACEPAPQPIHVGSDTCDYCRMMISDQEFASQVLNKQGRAFKFDSVECMAAFDQTRTAEMQVHSLWVPDFLNPEQWVPATDAVYLHSTSLRSPMGLFLTAYANADDARQMLEEYGGALLDYAGVRALVQQEWLEQGGHRMH